MASIMSGHHGVNYDAAFRDIVRGVVLLAAGHGAPIEV